MSASLPPVPGPAELHLQLPKPADSSPGTPQVPTSPAEWSLHSSAPSEHTVQLKSTMSSSIIARRTLGLVLMLVTVVLWTLSNFLASTIFADNSFPKPYFVTYANTAGFSAFLLVGLVRRAGGRVFRALHAMQARHGYMPVLATEDEGILKPDNESDSSVPPDRMTTRATARLALEFSILWFVANWLIGACLQYTTVASSTILMSTSGVFTLLIGSLAHVEVFTVRKLLGVLTSLAGIALISRVDLSGETDRHRGTFPHKSAGQIAAGDAMAMCSALLYGIYAILMKKRIGDERRVDLLVFFGFIGVANTVLLWPGFFILHWTGLETFELPPSRAIWTIVIVNAASSLLSDFCWAYAMLLTSPLVVTVGISLTIPLSLVGQMVLNSQSSSITYWIGAVIVFLSFIFINHETKDEEITKDISDTEQASAIWTHEHGE